MAKINMPVSFEDAGASILEPGLKTARISSYKLKKSQAGNDYLLWTMKVIEPAEETNRPIWYRTPLTENAMGFLKDLCLAIGTCWDDDGFDPDELLGQTLTILVDIEKDDKGNDRNVVKPMIS